MGHNWMSAQVVNSHLVCDSTIRQPGFDLPRQQWSLLNRFRTEQGHCGACRRKWQLADTDLCPCGETQMIFHIVESCPLTKLNGGLSRLHSADEDAVSWLTSYGSWTHTRRRLAFISGSVVLYASYLCLSPIHCLTHVECFRFVMAANIDFVWSKFEASFAICFRPAGDTLTQVCVCDQVCSQVCSLLE